MRPTPIHPRREQRVSRHFLINVFRQNKKLALQKVVKLFLDISHKWGAQRADYYHDGDGKYILKTHHFAIAVLTWMYYMIFYPFSGG